MSLYRNEFFTKERTVQRMCALCEPDISDIHKKIFEPGCGTGNFLVEIFSRRIIQTHGSHQKILIALSNLYGVDISSQNITSAKRRLRSLAINSLSPYADVHYTTTTTIDRILAANLICGDLIDGRRQIYFSDWSINAGKANITKRQNLSEIIAIQSQQDQQELLNV